MGMIFLELMPEVKFNVTVIRKQYATLRNDLETKFDTPKYQDVYEHQIWYSYP